MKIVLFALNSSYIHTNIAVRCIAQALGRLSPEIGECVIVERTVKDKRRALLDALYEQRPDICGFSVYIWNRAEMLSIASQLKGLLPECKIIFGGPEVSFESYGFFAENPFIDALICGEGEDAFSSLCSDIAAGRAFSRIIKGVAGDSFLNAGTLYDKYPAKRSTMLYYESSRGCPFRCAYCLSSLTGKVRCKSSEVALAELAHLSLPDENGHYAASIIKLVDRTFNFDRRRAADMWRAMCGDAYPLTYHFEVCAELLDDDAFDALANAPAGRFLLEVGVQSTNPPTLDAVGRSSDITLTLAKLARLHSMKNLHIHADLIAGLPYEGYERFSRSFDELYPLCDVLQLGFLKFLRGTSVRADADKYGCVYSDTPPYEILKNDFISYDELSRLHGISDALERFGENGKFDHTIEYALSFIRSPFALFDTLRGSAGADVTAISQSEAYRVMQNALSALGGDEYLSREYLRFDFLLSETVRCPDFLRSEEDRSIANEQQYKNMVITALKSGEKSAEIFIPALEVHYFGFDKPNIYVIDRKNGTFSVMPKIAG